MQVDKLKPHLGTFGMLAIGLLFFASSLISLDLGTLRRLGPGAFPLLVSTAVIGLSLVVLAKDLLAHANWQRPDYRSAFFVSLGLSAFAMLTPILGVLPATMISVFASGGANPRVPVLARFILAVCVALGVWIIFVLGLKMPFTLVRGL